MPMLSLYQHLQHHLAEARRLRQKRAPWRGNARYCVLCDSHVRAFLDAGWVVQRLDGKCPVCNSLERHRFGWYYLQREGLLRGPAMQTMLHIAPEVPLRRRLTRLPNFRYITGDAMRQRIDVKLDLTLLPFDDDIVDLLYCSHVLEHIPDDIAAMTEIRRVLRDGGSAILMFPVRFDTDATDEDPTIDDPEERLRRFGQDNHVRWYGRDVIDRLRDVGFDVQLVRTETYFSARQVEKFGLKGEFLYHCRKGR